MPQNDTTRWLSVFALAFGAFIFNTTEFIPIALLSDIGRSFAVPPTEAGIMITVYAWVVALLSLPLMLLTRTMERRGLLLALFGLFAANHVLSYWAWSFAVLLASRIGIALTHAVFWSITAALAVRIAPQGKANQALSLLSMGTVLAMVLGIPLGRMIGNAYGWRLSFLLIGAVAVLTAAVLAKNLPRLPSVNSGSLASVPLLLKRGKLMLLYAFTVLMVSAHFTAYSYIEPFVQQVGGFAPGQVTVLLVLYGVAGFVGSLLFGKWFARCGKAFFLACCAVMVVSMLLLYPLSGSPVALYALCLLWGAGISALGLAMLSRVLRFASDATDVATAMYSALFNVGIGGGALLGHYAEAWFGLKYIGLAGAALAALAWLLAHVLARQPDFAQ